MTTLTKNQIQALPAEEQQIVAATVAADTKFLETMLKRARSHSGGEWLTASGLMAVYILCINVPLIWPKANPFFINDIVGTLILVGVIVTNRLANRRMDAIMTVIESELARERRLDRTD